MLQMSHVTRLSVCLLVTTVSHAKTAEPIEIPFKVQTRVCPRNHALHGVHLANTIKRSVVGGDACCCYHYFSNLFY